MILTKEYLNQGVKKSLEFSSSRRIILESSNKSALDHGYDMFISHSYLDRDAIEYLIELFDEAGYSVYVDWVNDKQLDRDFVTDETARILKERLYMSKGLAYVSSHNIASSKWCPWELGLADGMKGKACIFPILESKRTDFKGMEFLGLYP